MQTDYSTDFLIIGAGFSGLVAAERLSHAGWKCTVVDRRLHIAGNAFDKADELGVLTHQYGPHYFRTNSSRIREYLSRFTDWHQVAYTIKSFTHGRYWSFPINLNTFEELIGSPSTTEAFEEWLGKHRVHHPSPKNSEELILSLAGEEFYRLFYEGYTLKQWKQHPKDLDPSLFARIPIRTNRDNRYLVEEFQALPKDGYTALFHNLLASSPRIDLRLGVDAEEAMSRWSYKHLIYSGAIDEYYKYKYGPLPYRSLRFEHEAFTAEQLKNREAISGKSGFWQPTMQVNYPDPSIPYTRIVEIKHATGQITPNSSITREFPRDWTLGMDPYYPVPTPQAKAAYQQYAALAAEEKRTSFIGRLATYRYYNMDQVTGMALTEADKLLARYGSPKLQSQ